MVNEARRFMLSTPWGVIWPSLAISSLVVGLSLLADGLREEITRYQK
jgi:peptide/nickel transport system permease protein